MDGVVTTVAGSGIGGFAGDGGPAVAAQLNSPRAIALAADGTLYIADTGNNRVRAGQPDGIITTIAGTGVSDVNTDVLPAVAVHHAGSRGPRHRRERAACSSPTPATAWCGASSPTARSS